MAYADHTQPVFVRWGSRIARIAKWLWEANFSQFLSTALVWLVNIGFVISVIYVLSQFSSRASVFFTQLLTLIFLVIGFAFLRFIPDFVRLINSIEKHSRPKNGTTPAPMVPMKWSIWYGNLLRIIGLTLPVTAPLGLYYFYYDRASTLEALILIVAVVFGLNMWIIKSDFSIFPKEQPKKLIGHVVVSLVSFAVLQWMWSVQDSWGLYRHPLLYLFAELFEVLAIFGFIGLALAFYRQAVKTLANKTPVAIALTVALGLCLLYVLPHVLSVAVYLAGIVTGLGAYAGELANELNGGGGERAGLLIGLFIGGAIVALFYILISDLWRAAPRILGNFMVAFPERKPDPGFHGRVLIYFRRVLLVVLVPALIILMGYLGGTGIDPAYLRGWPIKVVLAVVYIMALSDLLLFMFRWRSLVSGGQAETRISFPALRFFLKACNFINAVITIVTMVVVGIAFKEARMNEWLSVPIGILLYVVLTYVTYTVKAVVDIEAHTRKKDRAPLESTRYFGIWLFTMTMKTLTILGTILLLLGIVGFSFALKAGLVGLILGPIVAGIFYVFFGWLADFGHCLLCLENNVRTGSVISGIPGSGPPDQPQVLEEG